MDWKTAATKDDGAISIPGRWLHLHYYEALNILFRMENSLRVFVYVVLKNRFKQKWPETALQTADDEQSTIAATAAKRVAQAKGFGYLGYEISSPLMYLNSGELTRIITSETYWELFRPFFRGKKEIIKIKLDEIGTIRNALAHFRPIKYDDIELIKTNVKHAFVGIEECLGRMTSAHRVVPTNTKDAWYKNLITLGSGLCTIELYQNSSEEWVRIEIGYACALLKSLDFKSYRRFTVSNLISPAVIKGFPRLASHCTFVAENIPYIGVDEKSIPEIRKDVSLVFSRTAVEANYQEIRDQIKDVLLKVENETELVKNDNLARGEMIDLASVTAVVKTSRDGESHWWDPDASNMKCEFGENDPPEYWGEIGLYTADFIAGSSKYPWMPSPISKEESPFDF
jgi:hypothetical protein